MRCAFLVVCPGVLSTRLLPKQYFCHLDISLHVSRIYIFYYLWTPFGARVLFEQNILPGELQEGRLLSIQLQPVKGNNLGSRKRTNAFLALLSLCIRSSSTMILYLSQQQDEVFYKMENLYFKVVCMPNISFFQFRNIWEYTNTLPWLICEYRYSIIQGRWF